MRTLIFVGLAALPFYILNTMVMPELDKLARAYSSFDEKAEHIVNSKYQEPKVPAKN